MELLMWENIITIIAAVTLFASVLIYICGTVSGPHYTYHKTPSATQEPHSPTDSTVTLTPRQRAARARAKGVIYSDFSDAVNPRTGTPLDTDHFAEH